MWRPDVARHNKSNRDRDVDSQQHVAFVEGKTSVELGQGSSALLRLVLGQVATGKRWKPGRRSDRDHASEDPYHPFNYTNAPSVMRESDYAAPAAVARGWRR